MTYKQDHSYHSNFKEFPDKTHYAVLIARSITYDDGYGEDYGHGSRASYSTKEYFDYISFVDEAALKAWVIDNREKGNYRVIHVRPIDTKITVTVEVGE
jgi:hypothetical protein